MIKITNREQFDKFKQDFNGAITKIEEISEGFKVEVNTGTIYQMPINCKKWLDSQTIQCSDKDTYANDLIFGSDKTRNVVSCEIKDSQVYIYTEDQDGVKLETRPFKYWIMSDKRPTGIFGQMKGNLHYRYIKEFSDEKEFKVAKGKLFNSNPFICYDNREAYMVKYGLTYFKGMKVEDVSVLSFDIETTSLFPENGEVLLISNTYRKNGKIIRKLFDRANYKNELTMIYEWCYWVQEIDPSIMLGHNIFSFDLNFLHHRVMICQETQTSTDKGYHKGLPLGRDQSIMEISNKVSQFRYDGSQTYDYHKMNIFGREIIDTFFLSMKYDIGRNFTSYGLKSIVKDLGLEKEGRIIWDFQKDPVKDLHKNDPKKWKDFCEYCIDDGDDALKLFDIMIPSFFYLTINIPSAFQTMILTATGRQINSFMIRGYLQKEHSIPKASEKVPFQGAISLGIPGVYKNVFGLDFAALYPSIMRQWKVYDEKKDPLKLFLETVEFFATERNKNKKIANDTGEKYYRDLEQSQKVFANSCYGFLGSPGTHFNSPEKAAFITKKGRELFQRVLVWATGNDIDFWKEYNNE